MPQANGQVAFARRVLPDDDILRRSLSGYWTILAQGKESCQEGGYASGINYGVNEHPRGENDVVHSIGLECLAGGEGARVSICRGEVEQRWYIK